jgi:hypothetical protein
MFFERILSLAHAGFFDKYGKLGVEALKNGTPEKNSTTANSWFYRIHHSSGSTSIEFLNSNIQNGVCVAILLEYGHGTRYGAYVQGRRYIEPSIQPVFDQMVNDIWKEVRG